MRMRSVGTVAKGALLFVAQLAVPGCATAQDETEAYVWENSTELSFVSTGGNSSTSTLGLKSALSATGGQNVFKIELGGIRGETHLRTLTATGTATDFTVNETTVSQLTAESYFVRGRYDRAIASGYVFSGAGWDRNTFAGVQNRYALVVGLGKTWVESETSRFKTDLAPTYTIQKDVDPAADADEGFGGVNDRFGHEAGNEALEAVGRALELAGRDQDVAVRYGGEEFVLIMPGTGKEDAGRVADRVCRAIAGLELPPSEPETGVTMSVGIASYPVDALAPEALIRCADRAMYTAKAKGKNQAQLYGANRRALPRVDVALEGEIRGLKKNSLPFSTMNVSERGLRVRAKAPLALNSMVEFALHIPGHDEGVKAYGRVVRVYEKEDDAYQMAISMDIDTREHAAFTAYLRALASTETEESDLG